MFDQALKISEFLFNNKDIDTSNMTIVYELDEDEHLFLDKDLYVRKNGNLKNFKKNEEIVLNMNDVKFIFKKKS